MRKLKKCKIKKNSILFLFENFNSFSVSKTTKDIIRTLSKKLRIIV